MKNKEENHGYEASSGCADGNARRGGREASVRTSRQIAPGRAVFCIANRLTLFREHRLDARSLKAFQPQRCGLISSSVTTSAGLFTAAC